MENLATISFIVFLTIGYLASKIIQDAGGVKSNMTAVLVSILIPIITLIITVLLLGKGNPYVSGQVMGLCLISTISMMILMLFKLSKSKKVKTNQNKEQDLKDDSFRVREHTTGKIKKINNSEWEKIVKEGKHSLYEVLYD